MDLKKQKDILDRLSEILAQPPTSIEILPGDITEWMSWTETNSPSEKYPFLFVKGNLGVPKATLYPLYTVATILFNTSRFVPDLCQASSSVILLTNPAHQTALNARKRLIQIGFLTPNKELEFIEALLGLGKCAKQSIIWDHRRWIFKYLYDNVVSSTLHFRTGKWLTSQDLQSFPKMPSEAIQMELRIIRRASTVYPRNYHAWTHWHFIVDSVYAFLSVCGEDWTPYFRVLADEFIALRSWVDQHISDYSAMHHLCSLSRLFHDLGPRCLPYLEGFQSGVGTSTATIIADHALALTHSYPMHESLWIYLREAFVSLSAQNRKEVIEDVASVPRGQLGKQFLAWVDRFGSELEVVLVGT